MRVLFVLLPFIAACSSTYMQKAEPLGPPGANEAKVVFCRPSRAFGGAITFPIWDETKLLGFSESGSTIEYRCAPGPHFFIASAQTYKGMSADLTGGMVYYVWLTPRLGFLSAAVGLTAAGKDPELMVKVQESLKENEYRTLIPEQGTAYEKKRQDTIREVLQEFRSDKRTAEPPMLPQDGRADSHVPQP